MNSTDNNWKWRTLAHYYTVTDKGLVCGLCPNACLIKHNEKGICETRINFENKLYAVNYGNLCSVNTDPIEKKPLYHFLPQSNAFSIAAAGCNFTCMNCQNWQISQASSFAAQNYDMSPANVVSQALKTECKSIAYTYTEPVVFYEYVYDTAMLAREKGIKNVFISNGYINQEPLRKLSKYLDAANIDLKSFSEKTYRELSGGKLEKVKNTLKILKEEGVWLEITNLIIPTRTDDMDMIKEMCDWLYDSGFAHCPLHFNRFFPNYHLQNLPPTPVDTLIKARFIAVNAGIKYVYIGNLPGNSYDNTYCPGCKQTVIQRKGYTISTNNIVNGKCIFCGTEINGVWE